MIIPSEKIREIAETIPDYYPDNKDLSRENRFINAIIMFIDEHYGLKEKEAIRSVQPLGYIPPSVHTGEWCQACGAWKAYGVADTHYCTGYKTTC